MGRPAAIKLHAALSLLGLALYFVFVIPRWWVLTGDIPATAGTLGRIAAGLPIAMAAAPVWLVLQGSLNSGVPELALRLRAWSGMLHVVSGVLIVLTAVAEIWLGLGAAGPWLFAVYGAAGAMAILGVLGFYLSFIAELPPAGPKPPKAEKADKPKKEKRRGRKKADAATPEESTDATTPDETTPDETTPDETTPDAPFDAEEPTAPAEEAAADAEAESTPDADSANEETETADAPTLLNKRPTGKRRHRLPRATQ